MGSRTHLAELGKVALVTEWTLPETGVVVAHRVGLVELVTDRFFVTDAHHTAQHQLTCEQSGNQTHVVTKHTQFWLLLPL